MKSLLKLFAAFCLLTLTLTVRAEGTNTEGSENEETPKTEQVNNLVASPESDGGGGGGGF